VLILDYRYFWIIKKDKEMAEDYFLKALEVDPNYLKGLREYGLFLNKNDAFKGKERMLCFFSKPVVEAEEFWARAQKVAESPDFEANSTPDFDSSKV